MATRMATDLWCLSHLRPWGAPHIDNLWCGSCCWVSTFQSGSNLSERAFLSSNSVSNFCALRGLVSSVSTGRLVSGRLGDHHHRRGDHSPVSWKGTTAPLCQPKVAATYRVLLRVGGRGRTQSISNHCWPNTHRNVRNCVPDTTATVHSDHTTHSSCNGRNKICRLR